MQVAPSFVTFFLVRCFGPLFLSIRQPHLFWRILHFFFVTCNIWFSFSFLQFFRSVFASLLWFVVCVVLRVCLGAMRHVVDTTASKKPLGKCAFFFSLRNLPWWQNSTRECTPHTSTKNTHTHLPLPQTAIKRTEANDSDQGVPVTFTTYRSTYSNSNHRPTNTLHLFLLNRIIHHASLCNNPQLE